MKKAAHPLIPSTSPHPQPRSNYRNAPRHVTPVLSLHHNCHPEQNQPPVATQRHVLLAAVGATVLLPPPSRAEEAKPPPSTPPPAPVVEEISSRIYDATVIGEPIAVGKDKRKVWEKLMAARIVYFGEADQVPTRDDNVLELEIVRSLRRRCVETERSISLSLEAFPCDSQSQDHLNLYMDRN